MPVHQAFSKLYYDEYRARIDENWRNEVKIPRKSSPAIGMLKGDDLKAALADLKLTFTNKELKRLYAEASDDVKAKVEGYRKEMTCYVEMSDEDRRLR